MCIEMKHIHRKCNIHCTRSCLKYCDDRVCVCLSVREHISRTTRLIFTKFFMLVAYGRGSVLLWRCSDALCTSGFMGNVLWFYGCT